jgi:DNA repair exonuclease SbcCD ATPase subunit
MGRHTSTTDTFEQILERARATLETAREEYGSLEGTGSVPAGLVDSIADLEDELDELDQNLEVSETDIELAEATARRVEMLSETFAALRERQRTIVDADLKRLRIRYSSISELIRKHDLDGMTDPELGEIERHLSMLETLANDGRYEQVRTNDRISPSKVDASIRQVDDQVSDRIPDEALARTYVTIVKQLLDEIHESLSDLDAENEERTAHSSALSDIKQRLEDVQDDLDASGADGIAPDARSILNDCIELHRQTTSAQAEQRVARTLATTIQNSAADVDCDPAACVCRGDAETLLTALTDTLTSQVDLSTSARLRQLLREHDGSVVRTAEATDFDIPTIMDHLERLYDDGEIADLVVEFSQ